MSVSLVDFIIGTGVKVQTVAKDILGALVDPASFSATVFRPDGSSQTYVYLTDSELTRASLGTFVLAITLDQAGIWTVKTDSTSPQGAGRIRLRVLPSH